VGIAGHNGGAEIAALERAFPRVEVEVAFQLLRRAAVAGVAALDEDGADLLLEELDARDVGRGGRGILPCLSAEDYQEKQGDRPHAHPFPHLPFHYRINRTCLSSSVNISMRRAIARRAPSASPRRMAE